MSPETPARRSHANRWQVILLVAVFVAPMLVAWVAYRNAEHWKDGAGSAKGTLVVPARPVAPTVVLKGLDGDRFTLQRLSHKWVLTYLIGSECKEACSVQADNMLATRQALGEEMGRVAVLLIAPPGADQAGLRTLAAERPELMVGVADGQDPRSWFQTTTREVEAPRGAIYLIDPLGNLMMYYPAGSDPKHMLRDLLRLLKASQIG